MTMAIELKLLGAAIIIGLIYWAADVTAATAQLGVKWNVSTRENSPALTGVAHRIRRAFGNFQETFPFFAAAVIVAYLGGKLGPMTTWGCWLYVVGRAVYLPIYASGVPLVRSPAFLVSFAGIVMVITAIFI